jgi:hypothetical protein
MNGKKIRHPSMFQTIHYTIKQMGGGMNKQYEVNITRKP